MKTCIVNRILILLNFINIIIVKEYSYKRLLKTCYPGSCLKKCCDIFNTCPTYNSSCYYYCDPRYCASGCCINDKCGDPDTCKLAAGVIVGIVLGAFFCICIFFLIGYCVRRRNQIPDENNVVVEVIDPNSNYPIQNPYITPNSNMNPAFNQGGFNNQEGYSAPGVIINPAGFSNTPILNNPQGYSHTAEFNNQGGLNNQAGYSNQGGLNNQVGVNNQGEFNNQVAVNNQGGFHNQAGYSNPGVLNNQGEFNSQFGVNNQGGFHNQAGYSNPGVLNNQFGVNNQGGFHNQAGFSNPGVLNNPGNLNNQGGLSNQGGFSDNAVSQNKGITPPQVNKQIYN